MKIIIKNFTFKYPETAKTILEYINLTVESGEFVVVAGESGCGKTTLLKCLKPELLPAGEISGEIEYDRPVSPCSIGYVFQNPDDGIVCDKVWHELVFSLENQGLSQEAMQAKLDFAAEYFGIKDLLYRDVKELSGGQKQIINLAAAAIAGPDLLIFDEPISQLDREMAEIFLKLIKKLNIDMGITIIMSEHRLDEVYEAADRIVMMEKGRIIDEQAPEALNHRLLEKNGNYTLHNEKVYDREILGFSAKEPVLELESVSFSYRKSRPVLKDFSLKVYQGETMVLTGDNGSGKTTALLLLAGGMKPTEGKVIRRATSGMVPQNPMDIFAADPLNLAISNDTAELLGLKEVFYSHPYDLSGGQQQKLALAMVLDTDPDIIILDEPTKGLDSQAKGSLKRIISELKFRGKTIILVSHDSDFCNAVADRVIYMERKPRKQNDCDLNPAFDAHTDNMGNCQKQTASVDPAETVSVENTRNNRLPVPLVWLITITAVAATILGDLYLFSGKNTMIVSILVAAEMIFPFAYSFEKNRHDSRKFAMIAVISAIAVVSRAAFFMLPEFKPMAAFIIIAALALGEEEGFLVGALSALVSNFFFGQGPWTPWQMLAFGMIGFIAGIIYKNKDLTIWNKKKKILLCITGALLVIIVYGGLINLSSVLIWNQYPSLSIIIASYITGFPMDCIHALATVIFLWVFAVPMLEKIDRIKIKYQIS